MSANISGIIAIMLWSVSPLLIIGSGDTPPFLLGFLTLFIASLTLFLKYIVVDHKNFKNLIKQDKKAYFLTTYGIGGYICFWFLAFKHAPAFEANILNYLWPILLVGFSMTLKRENFSITKLLGLVLAFTGVVILFLNNGNSLSEINYIHGYIFAILAAVIWASYSTLTYSFKFPNNAMASFMIIPSFIFLGLHLHVEDLYMPNLREIICIFILGLTRISFSLWDYAMKNASISLIGSLSYFIPVISTALLVFFNFTPRNENILLAALLVLSGCLVVNFKLLIKKL